MEKKKHDLSLVLRTSVDWWFWMSLDELRMGVSEGCWSMLLNNEETNLVWNSGNNLVIHSLKLRTKRRTLIGGEVRTTTEVGQNSVNSYKE